MKIFLTGHLGYIGVHLCDLLKQEGHTVTGCDVHLFRGCDWDTYTQPDKEHIKDIRQLTVSDLEGHDCVMHLAAVSNDPMGEIDPQITYAINRDGTQSLAQKAKTAGVGRFLFASSCSLYGAGGDKPIDESGAVAPLSAYAESKIAAEHALCLLSDDQFAVTCLRNATAYGASPMLRIDLVANNLLASAMAKGEIRVLSDGTPWRPLIHCRDIARVFVAFLNASTEVSRPSIVNVGACSENYQVREVIERVHHLVPSAKVVMTGEVGADPRNYRVDFRRLNEMLPDFRFQYTLQTGLEELHREFTEKGFSAADFDGDAFVRLRRLKKTYAFELNEL